MVRYGTAQLRHRHGTVMDTHTLKTVALYITVRCGRKAITFSVAFAETNLAELALDHRHLDALVATRSSYGFDQSGLSGVRLSFRALRGFHSRRHLLFLMRSNRSNNF